MSKVVFLLGIPYSGKTTYLRNTLRISKFKDQENNSWCISTDDYIEQLAEKENINVSDAYKISRINSNANKLVAADIKEAIKYNYDVYVDQTNCTIKLFDKVAIFPNNYLKYLLVFNDPDSKTIYTRIKNRPNKIIPYVAINGMKKTKNALLNDERLICFDMITYV